MEVFMEVPPPCLDLAGENAAELLHWLHYRRAFRITALPLFFHLLGVIQPAKRGLLVFYYPFSSGVTRNEFLLVSC